MNKFTLVLAFVMFSLGAIAGRSTIAPASISVASVERTVSTFDLQSNAPAHLPVQRYNAI
jgi:hypothetical protein